MPTLWVLVGPDARIWRGESPIKVCAAAQRDTIDPVVAMERINAMVAEENAIRDAELADAYEKGIKSMLAPLSGKVDEDILALATKLFPDWREDIQEAFVLQLGRAIVLSMK